MPRPTDVPDPTRALPPRPNLDQLKKQAKELLAAYRAGSAEAVADVGRYEHSPDPTRFALQDAQRVLARSYGFASWSKLKERVGRPRVRMIRPPDIRPEVWETLSAAASGDVEQLRSLLAREPGLAVEGYWYTPPIHFAVREGHLEAVRVLLEAGADPGSAGLLDGENLVTIARDRGYEEIARAARRGRPARPPHHPGRPRRTDHPIHVAAAADDVESVRRLLDAEPGLVHLGDRKGARRSIERWRRRRAAPSSCSSTAARTSMRCHGPGRGDAGATRRPTSSPIDLALWNGRRDARDRAARLLLDAGADLRPGDRGRARRPRANDGASSTRTPRASAEARPCGTRRALRRRRVRPRRPSSACCSTAAPIRPGRKERSAARGGAALRRASRQPRDGGAASRPRRRSRTRTIDSSGNATWAARTRGAARAADGARGKLDTYDLVWLGEDDEVVRRVAADPARGECRLRRRVGGRVHAGQARPRRAAAGRGRAGAAGGDRLPLVPAGGPRDAAPAAGERHEPRPAELAARDAAARPVRARRPRPAMRASRGVRGDPARRRGRRSPPGTTNTARRRSPGRRATTCPTWSSCCSPAARRPTCRTTSRGRRRSPGHSARTWPHRRDAAAAGAEEADAM